MKIEIARNLGERIAGDNRYIHDVLKGKPVDKGKAAKTLLVTPELFAKIFSPERIKLLLKLGKEPPENIYRLAKALDRKYEAVFRDLKLLEGYGLIVLKAKNRERVPVIEHEVKLPSFEAG
ncbi:hypothetical protein HYU13_05755 [Candidatus Woesearchaeota archaeon]|nr:hypothetical protein [Candidatus Woesearchaeota archaeon]